MFLKTLAQKSTIFKYNPMFLHIWLLFQHALEDGRFSNLQHHTFERDLNVHP